MSDPGPYQSRLLNFLVPQYRRLVEKGDRAIRQMQVAVSWAAQVVIYPVYLLLQTTRVAFRQLGQAVKAQLPQLKASVERSDGGSADTPINQVLLAVLRSAEELVLTPDVIRPQSPNVAPQHGDLSPKQQEIAYRLPPATPKPVDPRGGYKGQVIRGVATDLKSKNLVLVTADNQELNIFTSSQQKKIQQLIIWQLAKYWRHQRQQALAKRPLTWGKSQRKTIILPIRILGQVMAWVQLGTVARTIDLFGESSLVHQPRKKPTPEEIEAIASMHKVDSYLAALESQISIIIWEGRTQIERQAREITSSPSQTSSVTDGSEREKRNIFALLGAAMAYFFGSQGQDLDAENSVEVKQLTGSPVLAARGGELQGVEGIWRWQAIKNQVGRLRKYGQLLRLNKQEVKALGNFHSEEVTAGRTREKENRLAIIGAAIAYFLGNKGGDRNLPGSDSEKVQQLTGRERRLTGAQKAIAPIPGQPDVAEAPGQTGSWEVQSSSQVEQSDWVTWSDIFGTPAGKVKPTPGQAAPNRLKRKQAVPQAGAAKAEEVVTLVGTTVSGPTPDQQAPGDNRYIQLTPDWIETAATPSGYVKHPLEKILEWLDRGILWLEDRALGIWKWLVRQ